MEGLTKVLYDARWIGNHGIGRFAGELQKLLPGMDSYSAARPPWHPVDPLLLGATLRQQKPRLFFSPGYNSPLGWPGAFAFVLHDLHHLRVPENSNAFKRAYYRHVIKPACHRAECVLTVSEYSRNEIIEWSGMTEEKIVNVGNGVSSQFSTIGSKYDPGFPYLLYVGSRKAHKNLPRLLEAYSLAGVSKEVRLVLSGAPDSSTTARIHHLGLENSVSFHDLPDDIGLAAAYRGAAGFLFPSLYEGFGLPPLEAMACGAPVLTSNVCALPEVVGNAALLVNPFDVNEIADAIKRLVHDAALQARLRRDGIRRAARFSWEETARKACAALGITDTIITRLEQPA
jgi:glycosyltransferase involved in cell wall biosynthesis